MTTRNPSRRFSPSLPSGKHIGIAIASAAAGIVIGAAAVSQPFQSDDSPSTVASVPQASTNIAAGSGVTNDSIQPSAQERKLSPTGVNGFRDFDPDLVIPGLGAAAASPDPTTVYESLGDLTGGGLSLNVNSASSQAPTSSPEFPLAAWLAGESEPSERELVARAIDEHGAAFPVAGGGGEPLSSAVKNSIAEREALIDAWLVGPYGRTGFRDFDPTVTYTGSR